MQIGSVGSNKKSIAMCKEVESHMKCVCTHLHSLFSCFGSTDDLFQMKSLLIQTKNLVFWYITLNFDQNPRYFKFIIFVILGFSHTFDLKYFRKTWSDAWKVCFNRHRKIDYIIKPYSECINYSVNKKKM